MIELFENTVDSSTNDDDEENKGQIIVCDTDLSAISIRYIESLIGKPVKRWILENTWQRTDKRPLYLLPSPQDLLHEALDSLRQGENIIIHTGSQKMRSRWSTQNLETVITELFPYLDIIRIDAESVSDPDHPAYGCMRNFNDF